MLRFSQTTIDGSEIQRSPVDVGSFSMFFPLFTWLYASKHWLAQQGFLKQKKSHRSGPVGTSSAPKVKRISGIKAATRRQDQIMKIVIGFGDDNELSLSLSLLGGGFSNIFMFTPIWWRFPFWLIFFRWVETTNQICCDCFWVELGCKLQTF